MKIHLFALLLLGIGISEVSAASRRPLLFPNPERPSSNPVQQVREQLLQRFDSDEDGFLDKREREAIRLFTKQEANDRMERFLERRKNSREEEENRPPERWLKLYDKNKNRRFDGGEWDVAFPSEVNRVTAIYDKDTDKQLDETESKAIFAALKAKKLNGYDRYILRTIAGLEGKNNEEKSRGSRWDKFDSDRNGKASPSELEAIRAHEATKGVSNAR